LLEQLLRTRIAWGGFHQPARKGAGSVNPAQVPVRGRERNE
jgi:hypothetical protein